MNTLSAGQDDSPTPSVALKQAQLLPSHLIAASAGTGENVLRAPGLILTRQQLINVKHYETRGLSLPTKIQDVIWYLGYVRGAGPNLEAADFQKSFALIHGHAARWNPIRTKLMNVGSELRVFADQMQVYSQGVEEIYQNVRSQPQDSFDSDNLADVLHCLDRVSKLVQARHAATNEVKATLDSFALELSTRVMPTLQMKLQSIRNSIPSGEVGNLITAINERATRIKEKQREYQTLLKQSSDRTGNTLDLAVYADAKVEQIRKEIQQLRVDQERDVIVLEQKNTIHGALHRIRNDLNDLELVVLDADIATKNLVTVWNALHTFIDESTTEARKINDSLSLRRLMNAFKLVATPWRQIKLDADSLLKIFKEADSEFRLQKG